MKTTQPRIGFRKVQQEDHQIKFFDTFVVFPSQTLAVTLGVEVSEMTRKHLLQLFYINLFLISPTQ